MLTLNSIMIGTKQVKTMVAFYEKLYGKPADMTDEEHASTDGKPETPICPY